MIIELTIASALGILGFLMGVAGIIWKQSQTAARADMAYKRAEKLEDEFQRYQVQSATDFATNHNLKVVEDRLTSAINAFGEALERHTDRLDRLITSILGKSSDA